METGGTPIEIQGIYISVKSHGAEIEMKGIYDSVKTGGNSRERERERGCVTVINGRKSTRINAIKLLHRAE